MGEGFEGRRCRHCERQEQGYRDCREEGPGIREGQSVGGEEANGVGCKAGGDEIQAS